MYGYDEIHTPSEKMEIKSQPKAVRKLKILNKLSCLVINAPTGFQFPTSKEETGVEGGIARWIKISKKQAI